MHAKSNQIILFREKKTAKQVRAISKSQHLLVVSTYEYILLVEYSFLILLVFVRAAVWLETLSPP